jgi:hypothetical protein
MCTVGNLSGYAWRNHEFVATRVAEVSEAETCCKQRVNVVHTSANSHPKSDTTTAPTLSLQPPPMLPPAAELTQTPSRTTALVRWGQRSDQSTQKLTHRALAAAAKIAKQELLNQSRLFCDKPQPAGAPFSGALNRLALHCRRVSEPPARGRRQGSGRGATHRRMNSGCVLA